MSIFPHNMPFIMLSGWSGRQKHQGDAQNCTLNGSLIACLSVATLPIQVCLAHLRGYFLKKTTARIHICALLRIFSNKTERKI